MLSLVVRATRGIDARERRGRILLEQRTRYINGRSRWGPMGGRLQQLKNGEEQAECKADNGDASSKSSFDDPGWMSFPKLPIPGPKILGN